MKPEEFAEIAAAIRTFYGKDFLPNEKAMSLWYAMLKDIPYNLMEIAVKKWVMTQKFCPTIAELRAECARIQFGEAPDWSAEWEKVLKKIDAYGSYREAEALLSMDDTTRKIVRRIGWRNICRAETDAAQAANRAAFRTSYEAEIKRKWETEQLPERLRDAIAAAVKTRMLESLKGIDEGGDAE